LQVKVTEPFSQFEPVKGLEAPEKFNQLAFSLTPEEPIIDEPIVGQDAVYIVALDKKIPSRIPSLAEIQDRVTEDYKRVQSREMATRAGQEFYAKVTAALAAGKAFNAAAFEAGQTVTTIPPFSMVARSIPGLDPRIDVSSIKNTAFALKEGETSQFVPTRDGGFVLHVNKLIPVNDAEVKSALPNYLAGLQKSGQSEAFNEWFSKEFQTAKLSLVTDKQETGGGSSSSTQ
jgi:parvulin-like peptidyl-prolyl isomerase